MKTNDDSKKKMIDTLITRVNEAATHSSFRPESAANLLDYVRNVEQSSGSALVGIATEDTIPEQPDNTNVIYMAGVKPGSTVTFQNFRDSEGQPISITAGGKDTMFALLLWNKQHWSYQTSSAGFIQANTPEYPSVREGDELLPRVAPNVSLYGTFRYVEENGYHAHESIAYDSTNKRLLFGVSNSYEVKDVAYLYITDMNLKFIELRKIQFGYFIHDMAFGYNNSLMIAPKDPRSKKTGIVRIYEYPSFESYVDVNLSAHFPDTYIEALCYSPELEITPEPGINPERDINIVKGGSKIVFYNKDFTKKIKEITIDPDDMHGDLITPQTIEYYNGYILNLNAGRWNDPIMGSTKNAYLNVYRMDGSKVETYRYPDSAFNKGAQGICRIGDGKYLFTHYGGPEIEIRLLDFNTPSHTHTLSDIMDLNTIGTGWKKLYVNPLLDGKSYLAPDGTMEKPFPSVTAAEAYARFYLQSAEIILMDGNYGTVDLSNIHMDLTFKGLCKDACLIDKISIGKCRDLLFGNITFCDSKRPVEISSSTVEFNNCSFPNGKHSDPGTTETYGINISRNSAVTLKACEINRFAAAVNISHSKLFFEGNNALKGIGNHYAVRGDKSIIRNTKNISGKVFTAQALSLNECQGNGDIAEMKDTNGTTKPSNPVKGQFYFDLEANKPLWWNGMHWIDVAGKVY